MSRHFDINPKVENGEIIEENITSITLIEYPPIREYEKFRGKIYFIDKEEQIAASCCKRN